jgi:hypothetical protein
MISQEVFHDLGSHVFFFPVAATSPEMMMGKITGFSKSVTYGRPLDGAAYES